MANSVAVVPFSGEDEVELPIRPSSGRRRKVKGSMAAGGQQKKTPQRGMGVAKLERLRTMAEINNQCFADHATNLMLNSVSSKFNQTGYLGQMGGLSPNSDGCLNDYDFLGKNIVVTSTPNSAVNCFSQHCNACHKKKKVNGEKLGVVKSKIGDCGLLGLNLRDNQNTIKEENQGLPLVGYAVGNATKQGVEVVAVHRKGGGERGKVVMEYEFFPCSEKGDSDDLLRMKSETTSSSSSASFSSTTTMAGFDASNLIDLSLKLSY